jgi:formamidopyrimidine-DNA glycosylase
MAYSREVIMPELPEVETTVRGLTPLLTGERLARVATFRAGLRRPFPDDLVQRMTGATVTHLSRRAKYGLIYTDRDDAMIFHLGMSGRWRINGAEPEKHDHLLLQTGGGRRLYLHDPRRFGSVDLVAGDPEISFAPFHALGPEPLTDALSAAYLAKALAGKTTPIKLALLDQRVIAGLGNIYVCEALNLTAIAPTRAAGSIGRAKLGALVEAIRGVLTAAIAAGGSSLRDFLHPDGALGYFANDWRVYGREGQACPCGRGSIARVVQGGRSTFFCAKCQR